MIYNQVCKSWKVKHRLKFSLPKYQLIYINRKQIIDYMANVKLRRDHLVQEISIAMSFDIIFQLKFR